jgi:hypothetical protein
MTKITQTVQINNKKTVKELIKELQMEFEEETSEMNKKKRIVSKKTFKKLFGAKK